MVERASYMCKKMNIPVAYSIPAAEPPASVGIDDRPIHVTTTRVIQTLAKPSFYDKPLLQPLQTSTIKTTTDIKFKSFKKEYNSLAKQFKDEFRSGIGSVMPARTHDRSHTPPRDLAHSKHPVIATIAGNRIQKREDMESLIDLMKDLIEDSKINYEALTDRRWVKG